MSIEILLLMVCQGAVIALAVVIQIHPRIPTGSLASLGLGLVALTALVRLGRPIDELEAVAWGVALVVLLDILLHRLVPPIDWAAPPPPHTPDNGRTAP